MKSITNYLNSMKSMYFMLLACVTLLIGVASCSQDEFANYEPEKQQKYSKAELIEQALSRIPQTRAENSNAVIMVTIQDTIAFQCHTTETMKVFVDGEEHPAPITEINKDCNHIFTNGFPSHSITIVGSKEAIRELDIDNNGLIMLNVSGNTNLTDLSCTDNHLDVIGLTDCPLGKLDISNNEFFSVDLSQQLSLHTIEANHNRLTTVDISQNSNLMRLSVGYNQIKQIKLPENSFFLVLEVENNPLKDIDLSKTPNLSYLNASYTQITELDLSKNTNLVALFIENLLIKKINDSPICDTSFFALPNLWQLNIAYTPFVTLNIERNPSIMELNISGTGITQLDLSNQEMEYLYATHSQLTNLIYEKSNFKKLYELRIERTPFEEDSLNMSSLALALPSRTEISPGHLYTYSPWINHFASDFARNNWMINQ